MPFYLTDYTGGGTYKDPFRPVGSDQPGWSAIDLRPDAGRLDGGGLGKALLFVPEAFSDPRAELISDHQRATLGPAMKKKLGGKLGVSLANERRMAHIFGGQQKQDSFHGIVARLLLHPPENGWNPLKAGVKRRRYQVWLGGLLWELDAEPETFADPVDPTDDFNRADENPIASPWSQDSSPEYKLVSNQMKKTSDSDHIAWYAGSCSTPDQYAELVGYDAAGSPSNGDIGGVVRSGLDGSRSGYFYDPQGDEFGKFTSGGFSSVASTGGSHGSGGTLAGTRVEGSTLYAYENGVRIGNPATDTSFYGVGNGAGVFLFVANTRADSWAGGDWTGIGESDVTDTPGAMFRDSHFFTVNTNTPSTTFTLTKPIPVGSYIVLCYCTYGWDGQYLTTVTDTDGDTFSILETTSIGSGSSGETRSLVVALVNSGLAAGDTITLTTNSTGTGERTLLILVYDDIEQNITPIVSHNYNAYDDFGGPSTTPHSQHAVGAPGELVIGIQAVRKNPSFPTWTPTDGFTERVTVDSGSNLGFFAEDAVAYDSLDTRGEYRVSPVASVATNWQSFILVLRNEWHDEFERGGSQSTLGSHFTQLEGQLVVTSGSRAQYDASDGSRDAAIRNDHTYSPDQFAECEVYDPNSLSAGDGMGVVLRGSGTTYYAATVGNGAAYLSKVVSGTPTVLATRSVTWTNGDRLRAEIQGTTVRLYQNGVQLGADITDSSIAKGNPGICAITFCAGMTVDAFWAGSLVETTPTMLYHEAFTDALWTNSAQGSPTRVTTPVHGSEPAALQINPSAATEYVFYENYNSFGESPERICTGFWFYLDALPAANREIAASAINVSDEAVVGVSSTGEIWVSRDGGTGLTGTGRIVPIQTWVWIELMVDVSANPWLLGVRVDDSAETWITNATAASNLNSGHLHIGPTGSTTITAYYGLPHYAIPDSISEWMGPQAWPGFGYLYSATDGSGGTSGHSITLDTTSFTTGDTILFAVHVLDSVKASVASLDGATRVTDWVTGEADAFGVPAYSIWRVQWDGVTDQYDFTWTDTGGRGSALLAIAIDGNVSFAQTVTGTDTASTSYRDSPTINATPGSTVLAFEGGSATDHLPVRWKAPFWPMKNDEFYGGTSVALATGASGLVASTMPSQGNTTQSMWILIELGAAVAPPAEPTFRGSPRRGLASVA